MNNWLAVTIIILSLFSTFFSGAYLVIALHGPRYDIVGKNGTLTISSARVPHFILRQDDRVVLCHSRRRFHWPVLG